jgi:hypothetical protein
MMPLIAPIRISPVRGLIVMFPSQAGSRKLSMGVDVNIFLSKNMLRVKRKLEVVQDGGYIEVELKDCCVGSG